MSVLGPRPPRAVSHNEQYRKLIKGTMLRHKVKPGITGRAQVKGLRSEAESPSTVSYNKCIPAGSHSCGSAFKAI